MIVSPVAATSTTYFVAQKTQATVNEDVQCSTDSRGMNAKPNDHRSLSETLYSALSICICMLWLCVVSVSETVRGQSDLVGVLAAGSWTIQSSPVAMIFLMEVCCDLIAWLFRTNSINCSCGRANI